MKRNLKTINPMKRLLIVSALLFPSLLSAQVAVTSLRTDRLDAPNGISPENAPTLSWIIESPAKNTVQTAYEVTVRRNGRLVWQSGKVDSDNSTNVKYDGALLPDSRYDWSVRVWDNHGNVSKRASSSWHTGLRHGDWQAEWITGATKELKPVYFRTERTLKKRITRATAYITAHGLYEAYINGRRVGDYYLTPGWTSYNKRLQYQAYDVTDLLKSGRNAVGAVVSAGWYSGGLNYVSPSKRYRYGDDIALLMQINVEYSDGTKEVIATDGEWLQSGGEIVFANIYDGQTVDARFADKTWATVDCPQWTDKATVAGFAKDNLVATENEPVVKHASLHPVKYIVTPKGEKVLDFGQNIVGWETARLRGKAGDTVRIYHAEILDQNGNFYTTNLRRAKATSTYILRGDAEERFEPTMTFYGFRYIKVDGVDGDLNPDDFTAEVVYSGFGRSGEFASSMDIINRLQSNIEWGFHDNFVDVPTDCPQRDERLGWTGDAQVFFRTASFLGNVDSFFRKWLSDLSADQYSDGRVPKIIPDTFPVTREGRNGATGWSDAATIIPWQHYMAYGDASVLEKQYPSMKLWVDYMISESRDRGWLWNTGVHYGDWLFWSKPNDPDGKSAVTSQHLVAQCFFANSVDILRRAAELLGKNDDAVYYADILHKVRKAYLDEYVTPNGLISSDTQTAYVLALHFDLLPENLRAQALDRLVANIERYGDHITTGFLGTPYICNVLTDNGRSDVAYRLLLQKTCPSWIYPITKGATTIWERWDSIRPDGSIIKGMNSFNHYSYGAIGDWLYRSAVGIRETSAGYKTIAVRPHVGGGFEWMKASTVTPYGKVAAEWHAEGDALTSLDVTIPVNTTAEIFVPAPDAESVAASDPSLKPSGFADGYAKFAVGSGTYRFTVK